MRRLARLSLLLWLASTACGCSIWQHPMLFALPRYHLPQGFSSTYYRELQHSQPGEAYRPARFREQVDDMPKRTWKEYYNGEGFPWE